MLRFSKLVFFNFRTILALGIFNFFKPNWLLKHLVLLLLFLIYFLQETTYKAKSELFFNRGGFHLRIKLLEQKRVQRN